MTCAALDEKLYELARISLDVRRHDEDGRALERRMLCSFSWFTIAEANPDMTAEEIAIAATIPPESP